MKLTLFVRLLGILCGVATVSTGLALALQHRSLTADLELAAEKRLETAVTAANRLAAGHLDALTERYRAVSGTPQFRANLEVNDAPTLTHYAESLRDQQGALRILFLDRDDRVVAGAGETGADARAIAASEAVLVSSRGRAVAVVSVPLETGAERVGRLVAVHALHAETLASWSELCGAQVSFRSGVEAASGRHIETVAQDLGELQMRVVLPLTAEREALARSRRNLLLAGLLALAAALSASVFLSRGLVRPILEIQQAAQRIGTGDLTVQVHSGRRDELGDVARAFAAMVGGLRATVGRVTQAADGVEATAAGIAAVTERLASVTAEQVSGNAIAIANMDRITDQMEGIAETAGASAQALDLAVDGSSTSFRELGSIGEDLSGNATLFSTRAEEISDSIERMTQSARQVAENTGALSSAAEQTASSMEEMASTTREVNANAEETTRRLNTVVETAERGRMRVLETITGMEAIRAATEESRQVISDLGQRVEAIGAIVSVIDQVTSQTGLLALNASIIAAQAGEHGRAFAVVAGEMNALADRVFAGTKEIDGLVRAVQAESEKAVAAIARSAESVKSGVDRAAEAGLSLEEITAAARESCGRMNEIVYATTEQKSVAHQVADQMASVLARVEEIRLAGEEQGRGHEVVFRSSVALRDVARQVRAAIEVQSRGTARIGENIETVQRTVEAINTALQQQSKACLDAAESIASATKHTSENEALAAKMGETARELLAQADELRADVRRFRI
jgi:methyl-accepting chemotaxis protein